MKTKEEHAKMDGSYDVKNMIMQSISWEKRKKLVFGLGSDDAVIVVAEFR